LGCANAGSVGGKHQWRQFFGVRQTPQTNSAKFVGDGLEPARAAYNAAEKALASCGP
jgi:hypothetical protein